MPNTPPALTGFAPAVTFASADVSTTPQLLDSAVTFLDLENDLDGGTLTVSGLLAEDIVAVRNQGVGPGEIFASGGLLIYDGTVFGNYSGGNGATFTVTFNVFATSAAVEALIENITYSNLSGTPTASRTLVLNVDDAQGVDLGQLGEGSFVALPLTFDPFNGVDVGSDSAPAFVDLDGDGDMDAVFGNNAGTLLAYQNSYGSFVPLAGAANPFNLVDVGNFSHPAFVDLDGDLDMDVVVGTSFGVRAFTNIAGVYVELTGGANPFNGLGTVLYNAPTFADIDGDGDQDMVLGIVNGTLRTFRNTGGTFAELIGGANPFNGLTVTTLAAPAFVDIDADGDQDLVVGSGAGTLRTFRNNSGVFTEVTGAANPFDGVDVGANSAPRFVDYNGNNDMDLVVGNSTGTFTTFLNTSAHGKAIVVNVTPPNTPPTLTGLAAVAVLLESAVNAAPVLIDSDVTFADAEQNFTGGTLTVTGLLAEDKVAIRNEGGGAGQIGLSGSNVTYGGTTIGSFTGGLGGTLTVTFNASANNAAIDALIQNLTYANDSNAPTNLRGLTVNVIDAAGAGFVASGTISVFVTEVNDVPSGADDTIGMLEDRTYHLAAADFGFSDSDGDVLSAVIIESVGGGTIWLDADGAGGADPVALTYPAIVTVADLNAGKVTFVPDADVNGTGAATLTFRVQDDGGTANGGIDTDASANTLTFDIAAVNDRPMLSGFAANVTFTEAAVNAAPVLIDSDVVLTDAEGNIGGGTLSVSGLLAEDVVAIRDQGIGAGQIGVSGTDVTYEGTVIGSFAGGDGDTFTVTLDPAATVAAVDALIQNLTFANAGEPPAASRTLVLNLTDADGANLGPLAEPTSFVPLAGAANPFDGLDVGGISSAGFADLDGDGDMDAVIGDVTGILRTFENTGGDFTELFGTANPFDGVDVGATSRPSFVDVDGDGDIDVVVGDSNGYLRTFEKQGGVFTELTGGANPFAGFGGAFRSSPSFVDLDDDGDMDAVIGNINGVLRAFENIGGTFTELTGGANPFNGVDVGFLAAPSFFDLDGDGDMDAVVGEIYGLLRTFENTGGTFTQMTGVDDPFDGVDTGNHGAPSFVDLDSDGDMDAVVGNLDGTLFAFENLTSLGQQIVINVTPTNDAPSGSDATLDIDEDEARTLSVADFGFGDGESDEFAALIIDSATGGTIWFDADGAGGDAAEAQTLPQTFTKADLDAGKVTFVPDADANGTGAASLTFRVQDDGGTADGGIDTDASANTLTFDIEAVNDAPALGGFAADVTFTENAAAALIDADVDLHRRRRQFRRRHADGLRPARRGHRRDPQSGHRRRPDRRRPAATSLSAAPSSAASPAAPAPRSPSPSTPRRPRPRSTR